MSTTSAQKRRERLSAGMEVHSCTDINSLLGWSKECGYEFIVVPLREPLRETGDNGDGKKSKNTFQTLRQCYNSRADVTVETGDWNTLVVFRTSTDINCDSKLADVEKESEAQLTAELNFAAYLAVPAVIIPLSMNSNNTNLARMLYNHCAPGMSTFQIWVEVPVATTSAIDGSGDQNSANGAEVKEEKSVLSNKSGGDVDLANGKAEDEYEMELHSWKQWNKFRLVNNYNKRLGVILRITENVPSSADICRNWISEPLKALIIDVSVFTTNQRGYPVLTQAHQKLITIFFTYFPNLQIVVTSPPTDLEMSMTPYYQYLNHLFTKRVDVDSIDSFSIGYENFLQVPLQPLADNLESQTYEVFEKDPVKYPKYQEAIQLAIRDKLVQYPSHKLSIMVLGAGRGPLVQCTINAAKLEKCTNFVLYAVEKNPNSILTLEYKNEHLWDNKVKLIASDMRDAVFDEKADIIVSELLGSFGDNELSPECLDGANNFIKPDAISIPTSYTSYIAPISSHIMHVECSHNREFDKPTDHCMETPYVVRLVNYRSLGNTKSLFTFTHPNWDEKIDNTRHEVVKFQSKATSIINGIAGYFDTTLYKNVSFGIVPETHSEGMFSWFPIYFPLKTPIHVKKDETISVHFWRCEDKHKVWYEWCLEDPLPTALHNPKGRSYFIGK